MIMFFQKHTVIDDNLRRRDFQIDNMIVDHFARLKSKIFQMYIL